MVKLGFDIRSTSIKSMQGLTDETISFLNGLTQEKGLDVRIESSDTQAPVKLSNEIVKTIEKAALRTGVRFKRMSSGAGHDTQNMASIARTGMIFVPSVKGISHSAMEWTEWDDIEKGVSVLTAALKDLSVCN
jgi:acetylornithine deacetylase/succinyl-diaminopimelate desuccinylase-like protein